MESDRELWRKRHNDRSEQNDGISRIHCIVLDRGQDLTSYNPGDDLVAGVFISSQIGLYRARVGGVKCCAERKTMRVGSDSVVGYLRASSEQVHGVL